MNSKPETRNSKLTSFFLSLLPFSAIQLIMIDIKPFKALRPEPQLAKSIASKPYDVLSSKEAKIEAQGNPNSFLHITKSEIDLPDNIDTHSQQVYDKAKENLNAF